MKDIFEYLNYRQYLGDFFLFKKEKLSFYSYRLFSEQAGFKSPNFLKLVIEGKRSLTKDSVYKFCKGLRLKKTESDYFEALVFFNQAKTLEEKNYYLASLVKFRKKFEPHKIENQELKYFSNWYHPVIRELVCAYDFQDDFKKLGKFTIPAISPIEAEKSVRLLEELHYIIRKSDGKYEVSDLHVSTGPQIKSIAVSNYHKEMISLASESIERFSTQQRNITSLTLLISENTKEIIVKKIEALRKELLTLAESDIHANQVTQVNFQVFPLSEKMNEGEVK